MRRSKQNQPASAVLDGPSPLAIELWPVEKPKDYLKNARKWTPKAVAKVRQSLREFGFRQPLVVDAEGVIVIGHLRRQAARDEGFTEVPVHVAADLSPTKIRQLRLMDNRSHDEAEWDLSILEEEMKELAALDLDLSLTGFDEAQWVSFLAGLGVGSPEAVAAARQTLAERFVVPPFSVLDARQGYWQERKRAWLALGIQSEMGRGGGLIPNGGGDDIQDRLSPGGSPRPACDYSNRERGDGRGRPTDRGVVRQTAK